MPDLGEKRQAALEDGYRKMVEHVYEVEAERDEARQQLANLRAAVESAAWLPADEVFRGREVTKTLRALLADPACGGPE